MFKRLQLLYYNHMKYQSHISIEKLRECCFISVFQKCNYLKGLQVKSLKHVKGGIKERLETIANIYHLTMIRST